MLKGVPSPICWIHEWCGRPGCRRQPGPKRWPVLAAATCDNARLAGVWSLSLTTWPNSEFCLLRWHPEQRKGWSGRQLLCFWQSRASVSGGSYVGNACERPPASVDPPADVSTSPNHTTKWTVHKSGRCLQRSMYVTVIEFKGMSWELNRLKSSIDNVTQVRPTVRFMLRTMQSATLDAGWDLTQRLAHTVGGADVYIAAHR